MVLNLYHKLKFKKKFYIKPLSFVNQKIGKLLSDKNKALRLAGGNLYFTEILLISRGKDINERLYSVFDFLRSKIYKSSNQLKNIIKNISSRRSLLDNKNFFEKKKNYIFGILNITPDSFSDGGDSLNYENALRNANSMIEEGADFLDIGGESTRPGAKKISSNEELLRILPIIQELVNKKIKISVDTRNSSTMRISIISGASIINDVSALCNDKDSVTNIARNKSPVILMHMPGNPLTMMKNNNYQNTVLDVYDFLESRIEFCKEYKISKNKIIIDPGIGFGKDSNQNLSILKNISIFHSLGCPIMLGVSRKRFISSFSKKCEPKERFPGSIAAEIHGISNGVQILRVHDVKETRQAIDIWNSINL